MAMEDGMAAMFPNGIRTLLVDDDPKFLKSANELLSFLNFEVVVCSNVAHVLRSLITSGRHEGFDVILVHAAKAAASGFDFRAIIEANLLIPVIYFLPQGHKATGNKLLRALQAGTYVIKKPVDANELRNLLWKVIASRKRELETKARRGVQQGAEDEDRVQQGGQKRKCSNSPTGGSFFFSGTAAAAAAGSHPTAKGKENDNVASLQQPQPAQQKAAMMNGPLLNFFMNPAMPPFNPSFLSVADGPSNNVGTFAGAMDSAAPAAFPAHSTIFGDNTPSAAGPTMAAAATYEPQFSQVICNQQPQDVHSLLMFEPFPYQGPSPPAAEGGLFTASATARSTSATAAGAEARAYGNDVRLSFLQPSNHGAAQDVDGELADPAMVPLPQPFFRGAIDRATMEWLLSDDFDDYVSGAPPLVAPNSNQVLDKASNVQEPTATAGNTNAGLTAVAMPPSDDQCEDNTSSPLRDLHGPLSEFDDIVNLDFFMLGGFTGGGAAAADYDDDDVGTLLNTGEEGSSDMDGLGNLDGLPIPYDLLENFMVPCHKNWTNVRE